MSDNKVLSFDNSWLNPGAPPLVEDGDRLIRLPELKRMVGMGTSSIYHYIKRGVFPAPIKLERMSLWSFNQVQRWIRDTLPSSGSTEDR